MIKSHNKKLINKDIKDLKPNNCRAKSKCPLSSQCKVTDIIYKRHVLSPDKPNKVYLGTAEDELEKQFYNHKKLFNNENTTHNTTFSKYIWELKQTSNLKPTLL